MWGELGGLESEAGAFAPGAGLNLQALGAQVFDEFGEDAGAQLHDGVSVAVLQESHRSAFFQGLEGDFGGRVFLGLAEDEGGELLDRDGEFYVEDLARLRLRRAISATWARSLASSCSTSVNTGPVM